jgi:hypothetical protein
LGFFAVVSEKSSPSFRVAECHLNLWSLGGLFGYRLSCFDVGLLIEGRRGGVQELQLALPFGTRPDAMRSLHEQMGDSTVGSLIFARDDVVAGRNLVLNGRSVPLARVEAQACNREDHPDRRNFSLWSIRLTEKIKRGKQAYLRLRFLVHTPGRLWIWKRALGLRAGAIVDLRVSDEREAQTLAEGEIPTGRILPLERLEAFVIAPAAFQAAAVSPPPRYIRSLEGRVWERYLDRATDVTRTEKFLVYRWKGEMVTTARPFRGLLQLERHPLPIPSGGQLLVALLIIAALMATTNFDLRLDFVSDVAGDVSGFIFGGWLTGAISLGALAGLALLLSTLWTRIQSWRERFAALLGRLDAFVYSKIKD